LQDNKLLNYELRSLSDVNHQPLCVDGLPRVLETAVYRQQRVAPLL
jgi:hypothetical protein